MEACYCLEQKKKIKEEEEFGEEQLKLSQNWEESCGVASDEH